MESKVYKEVEGVLISLAIIIGFLVAISLSLLLALNRKDPTVIETKKPLIPNVEINIKNEVSDTTYIYKIK